jgi:hypothetical protein
MLTVFRSYQIHDIFRQEKSVYLPRGLSSDPLTDIFAATRSGGIRITAVAFPGRSDTIRFTVARSDVAIMEFASDGAVSEKQMVSLEDLLATEIRKAGAFRVIGKSDIMKMLQLEERKNLMGCSDDSCIAEKIHVVGSSSRRVKGGPDHLVEVLPQMVRELFENADLKERLAAGTVPHDPVAGRVSGEHPYLLWGHVGFWSGIHRSVGPGNTGTLASGGGADTLEISGTTAHFSAPLPETVGLGVCAVHPDEVEVRVHIGIQDVRGREHTFKNLDIVRLVEHFISWRQRLRKRRLGSMFRQAWLIHSSISPRLNGFTKYRHLCRRNCSTSDSVKLAEITALLGVSTVHPASIWRRKNSMPDIRDMRLSVISTSQHTSPGAQAHSPPA